MQRASVWKLIRLNASWLGLSFMWNSLHVILLPAVLLNFVTDGQKNTILGLLTGAGLVIAMVVQPLAGSLSDRWSSRWGRRRPFMLFGTTFDIPFLLVLGLAGGLPGILIGYIALQLTSNVSHGAMQGLMPDTIAPDQLGRGSSVKTVIDVIGLVGASLIVGRLISPLHAEISLPLLMIIAVLLASTSVTVFLIHEQPSTRGHSSIRADPKKGLVATLRGNIPFTWLILARFIFLLGIYGIQAFGQYYIRDTLPGSNPVKLTGDLMAAMVVGLVICASAAGYLSDRFGNRLVHLISAGLVVSGSLWMVWAHTAATVLIGAVILGAGIGFFLTANWALSNALAPQAEAGKFLGLTNLATAGAGAASRLFGPVIDRVNALQPGQYHGYTLLFLASAVFACLGWLLLQRVIQPGRVRSLVSAQTTEL